MKQNELYVLVAERDTYHVNDAPARPIVLEQYIDGDRASLDAIKARREHFGDRFGKMRIARLQFVDC